MDAVQKLLAVLADGEFHSGEELGELLGVSRTAVWKHLQKLEELSLTVNSVKGKGYCLSGGLELLSSDHIESQLSSSARNALAEMLILHSTDSTNDVARSKAEGGDTTGLVVLAERQTAGRGRRGREWVSPYGRNLYVSTVWGFDGGAAALEGLSLAVGVLVKRAIESCGLQGVQLKWPNDILYQRKKLGGILLEMIGDPAGFCQVVIGIGINVAMPTPAAGSITQDWTDLESAAGEVVSRNRMAFSLLNELLPALAHYQAQGFEVFRQEWEQADAFRGESVRLITPNREIQGVARGVSSTGAICLEVDGQPCYFNGGEISLRRADQ